MDDLLILTEGGEGIGLGHITRCSAIAAWVQKQGRTCRMVIDWHGGGHHPGNVEEANWMDWEVANASFRAVLVDSYKAQAAVYRKIKSFAERLVVMDDYHRLPEYGADLIVNPNSYGDSLTYAEKSASGSQYVILRQAFRECTERYALREEVKNIFVTVGGTDIRSMLPALAAILENTDREVVFVCGNEATAQAMNDRFGGNPRFSFYGFAGPDLMCRLMLDSDVAISACGQTLHELAYLGVPAIGIRIGDDQLLNQQAYINTGFLSMAIDWDSGELESLLQHELNGLNSMEARAAKSKIGMNIIDGKGVERIAQLIFHG
ncbi:MAG: glycosyltransferase [Chitinophagaceae bacterium]